MDRHGTGRVYSETHVPNYQKPKRNIKPTADGHSNAVHHVVRVSEARSVARWHQARAMN